MLHIEPKKYGHIGFIGNKALVRLRFAKDYFESDVVYLLKNHMLAEAYNKRDTQYKGKAYVTIELICTTHQYNLIKIATLRKNIRVMEQKIHYLFTL